MHTLFKIINGKIRHLRVGERDCVKMALKISLKQYTRNRSNDYDNKKHVNQSKKKEEK